VTEKTPTKIEQLREHLFATLESLRDAEKPMELERARAISDVAQTIINSAKVEVDYIKAVGHRAGEGTGFLQAPNAAPPERIAPPPGERSN